MKKLGIKISVLFVIFSFLCLASVEAASLIKLKAIRYSTNEEKDRIVFELNGALNYRFIPENDQRLVLELYNSVDEVKKKPVIKSSQIKSVKYDTTINGKVAIIIDLTSPAEHTLKVLKNPNRVYIDIAKNYEKEKKMTPREGIIYTNYQKRTRAGKVSAYFLEIDSKKYRLKPTLGKDTVRGCEKLSFIAKKNNAIAAINASYYDSKGTILGYMRLNGTTIGTTHLERTALGLRTDGTVLIDKLSYNASLTVGKVSLLLSGVNTLRGENGVVIYNPYYSKTTGTNMYGKEFIVRGGMINITKKGNSEIPADGFVLSVHGKSQQLLSRTAIGEKVIFRENIGKKWYGIPNIIGAGPQLIKDGLVKVTAVEEGFPKDITKGRAPRSAFAVLANGNYLFAVVDGRQASSIGCTLTEWAELLKKQGAFNAINFDGGGSTELILGDRILNQPSDGAERMIGSALIVAEKESV